MKKILFFALVSVGLIIKTQAAVVVSNTGIVSVNNSDFDLGAFARSPINALPISSSQQGGSYLVNAGLNGVGSVASGTAGSPSFSLTITNSTGSMLNSIHLAGTVFQLKGNTGGLAEKLTASVVGVTLADPAILDINTVVNQTGINNPPATAGYGVDLTNLGLASGESMTITWTDANDGGTDAFFGIGDVTVQAVAVPEPGVVALLGLGGALLVFRHRGRRATSQADQPISKTHS